MYQRKSSYIISAKGVRALLGGLYSEETPYPTEVADRLNLSMPNPLSAGASYRARKIVEEMDKSVLVDVLSPIAYLPGYITERSSKDSRPRASTVTRDTETLACSSWSGYMAVAIISVSSFALSAEAMMTYLS